MTLISICLPFHLVSLLSIVVLGTTPIHAIDFVATTHRANRDRVDELPLYGTPPAPQWSGFLDASESTPGTFLHYWFAHFEGKDDNRKKHTSLSLNTEIPVVVWFNGRLLPSCIILSVIVSCQSYLKN